MTPTRTPFAGFTRLAPGDPLSALGYSFQFENPEIADRLGQLGAVTHRHDAHAALADPTTAPTVATAATGGTIPGGTPIHVAYTLTDAQGGETLPVAPVVVTTSAGYLTPSVPPTAAPDYTAGALLANTYLYAVTVTDGAGGETALGPAATVTIDPGPTNARALISGLTAITNASSGGSTGAGWRLWRSIDGGSTWNLMATGPYSTDAHTDDGSTGGDCTVTPPFTGTTIGTNKLTVTVPSAGQPAGATFFSIYASTDGQFLAPCLLGTYAITDYDVAKVYTALALLNGQPPAVSSCYPGANKIDPDTDILNWPWKTPVANAAALPSSGNTNGDVRETLDTHLLYTWNGSAWTTTGTGGPPSGTAGGDLGGTYPNPDVDKIHGVAADAVSAKGDLLVTDATPALKRFPVGADGDVLTADSTQTEGVKWATPSGGGGGSGGTWGAIVTAAGSHAASSGEFIVVGPGLRITDGVATSGSPTLTSAAGLFTSALVGSYITDMNRGNEELQRDAFVLAVGSGSSLTMTTDAPNSTSGDTIAFLSVVALPSPSSPGDRIGVRSTDPDLPVLIVGALADETLTRPFNWLSDAPGIAAVIPPFETMIFVADGTSWQIEATARPTISSTGILNLLTSGVKADTIFGFATGNIAASSNVFTSGASSAVFAASDVGKTLAVQGALSTGPDSLLVATISAVNSETSVNLSVSADTTVTGANWCYGTDDYPVLSRLVTDWEDGRWILPPSAMLLTHALEGSPFFAMPSMSGERDLTLFLALFDGDMFASLDGGELRDFGMAYFLTPSSGAAINTRPRLANGRIRNINFGRVAGETIYGGGGLPFAGLHGPYNAINVANWASPPSAGIWIEGNDMLDTQSDAITVAANTKRFWICRNAVNAITIAAGTSDHYVISENMLHGAAITDGGTGTHKFVGNNI